MHLMLKEDGIYFNKKELDLEILERGDIIFYSKTEILKTINKLTGFILIGQPSNELKSNIKDLKEDLIYIVRLLQDYYCFCNSNGKVLNIKI